MFQRSNCPFLLDSSDLGYKRLEYEISYQFNMKNMIHETNIIYETNMIHETNMMHLINMMYLKIFV